MARLKHPHAVDIHDTFTAGGMAVIDMEYVPGRSLAQILRPGQPMPLDWTIRILRQLCDVLAEAHEAGIVHRDLKPANLMLLADRAPGREFLKVLDFGIAKLLDLEPDESEGGERTAITNDAPIGTYPYMSPEQFGTVPVDTRSDIYTVGVILYEILTGYRPFEAPNQPFQWLQKHVNEPVPAFRDRNPEVKVPRRVEQVVRRCLAKSPDDRPQSARELLDEFCALATEEDPGSIPLERPRQRMRVALALAVALGTALMLIGYWLWNR
jgi:eukaryotic-like serine/threonine-protein kinase